MKTNNAIVEAVAADSPAYIRKTYKTWQHSEPVTAIHDGYHFLSGLELYAPGITPRSGYPYEVIGDNLVEQIQGYIKKHIPRLYLSKRDLEHCVEFMLQHKGWNFINAPHPCLGVI